MNSENILLKIKSVLISQKIPTSPENIVKACFETILKLINNSKHDKAVVKTLFAIVVQMKHFDINQQSLEVISRCISEYTSEIVTLLKFHFISKCTGTKCTEDKCTRDIKCENTYTGDKYAENIQNTYSRSIQNEEIIHPVLFNVMVRHLKSQSVSNLLAKYISDINSIHSLKDQVSLIKNSLPVLGAKIDVIDFINRNVVDPEDMNDLIHSFLEYQYSIDGFVEIDIIKDIIENKLNEDKSNRTTNSKNDRSVMVRIITLLMFFYKKSIRNTTSANITPICSPKLLNLIHFEIFENQNNSEESLLEMVSHLSGFILPGFSSLLRDLNDRFINNNTAKYTNLLKNMISYIKIDEFIDTVGSIDISKHCLVFKGISNVDVSVFLDLYRTYPNDVDCVMSILPSLSYYCTDYYDNSVYFIDILKSHIKTHPTAVCSAIEKIVQSHKVNLQSDLKLNNPISREESLRFLRGLDGLLYELIEIQMTRKGNEFDSAIESLVEATVLLNDKKSVEMMNHLVSSLLSSINDQTSTSLYNALRLMPFFVKYHWFDFDFISRILELCSSSENDIQKKAYFLLYCIYSKNRTDVCICDILYSSLKRTVSGSSMRNRILLQYSIIKNRCINHNNHVVNNNCRFNNSCINSNNCVVNNNCINSNNSINNNSINDDNYLRFINEMIENITTGNHKCKKAIKEIINEIAVGEFVDYLILNMNSNDPKTVSGCVEISNLILNLNNACLDNVRRILESLIKIGSYSLAISKLVISIFIALLRTHPDIFEEFQNEILNLIDSYISHFSKNMNSQLREFCVLAEKKNILTRQMRSFLRLKNSGGRIREIKVVEKVEFKDLL